MPLPEEKNEPLRMLEKNTVQREGDDSSETTAVPLSVVGPISAANERHFPTIAKRLKGTLRELSILQPHYALIDRVEGVRGNSTPTHSSNRRPSV